MKRYLLSIYQPDGEPPPPERLGPIMKNVSALIDDMKRQGAFVFNGGLYPPHTATVLKATGDDVLITDGPYIEGKEHIGGFVVIQADDLDRALEWGKRTAQVITLPIEVRPLMY